jgi:hypothetical protein
MQKEQQVTALPYGSQETLTPEQELDLTPYSGSKSPLTGTLETIHVHADKETNSPAYTLYLVDNQPVDPTTIQEIETTETILASNSCHDPHSGEFCEGIYEASREYSKGLSAAKQKVVNSYSAYSPSGGYRQINSELRTNQLSEPIAKTVKTLDSVIEKAPPLEGITVYRGVGSDTYNNSKPGDILKDKGFQSTSIDKENASLFAKQGGSLIEIHTNQDTKGVAGQFLEKEIILPRNLTTKVISNTYHPPTGSQKLGVHHIVVEIQHSAVKASIDQFYNHAHDSKGRFAPQESSGGAEGRTQTKVDPSEIRKWAKDNGYQIGDRGRVSAEIIAAHKKANRAKPQQPTIPKPTQTVDSTPKPTGDFKTQYAEVSKGLSNGLRDIPQGEGIYSHPYSEEKTTTVRDSAKVSHKEVQTSPGPKLQELEAQTRKTGEVIHNEIVRRLTEAGIKEPDSQKAAENKQKADAIIKQIAETEIPFEDSMRIRDQVWGPSRSWSDEEHRQQLRDATEKEFPGRAAKVQALREEYSTYYKQMVADKKEEKDYSLAYRTSALQTLSEVRNGNYGNLDFEKVESSNKAVKEALQQAGRVYPDEWVVQSDRTGPIRGQKGSRGLHENLYTSDGNLVSKITVSPDEGFKAVTSNAFYPIAVHELGHRFEILRPHISALEWTFWHRRQEGEKPSKLQKLQPGFGYKRDEMAVKDKYIDPYIGKIYGDSPRRPFESFQMGVQYLFGGSAPIIRDKDYAHFILGILAAG